MHPNHYDLLGQRRDTPPDVRTTVSRESPSLTRSASNARRIRSEDSWIEISSQPSSSSLSSAATEEIVTTGLRVQHDSAIRRRRTNHNIINNRIQLPHRSTSNPSSSQDEYEESESESDRVMSSSNEDVAHRHGGVPFSSHLSNTSVPDSNPSSQDDEEEEDDDNATALGVNSHAPVFRPQPNAFSHPPASAPLASRSSAPDSYFPPVTSTSSNRSATVTQRSSSIRHARQQSHTPYNMIAPSHQADHDAALRASLSTLLSCAAAARGLSKPDSQRSNLPSRNTNSNNRIEPSTLRLVPESALDEEHRPPLPVRRTIPPPGTTRIMRTSSTSSTSSSAPGKAKRKASSSKDRHSAKKSRNVSAKHAEEMVISPTLMTWLVSAGVVVMFSALSFSAGYAFGKEVGRAEAGMGKCGNDALIRGGGSMSGLKRLRWGAGSTASAR